MDQKKIGEFLAKNRKLKKMTQEELAEKIGVTNKTISRWENGNYMPDLSLLQPLSEELGITVNELLQGEKIEEKDYPKVCEENILQTIAYSNKKIEKNRRKISFFMMLIGSVIGISATTVFPTESSWASIYNIIGILIFLIGLGREITCPKIYQKVILFFLLFFSILGLFHLADYIQVKRNQKPPMYRYLTTTKSDITAYYTLFYNVYRINGGTRNEYYVVDEKKKYTIDTIPVSPFNQKKSGIDNLLQYQSKYIGDHVNDIKIIENLPLAEYGYTIEIDSHNLGLTINYGIADWYVNGSISEGYLEKSLLYNSISLFCFIDNVKSITYHFSGNSYFVTRKQIEENYPNYSKVRINSEINKENFKQYVEQKMLDNNFVQEQFQVLFGG